MVSGLFGGPLSTRAECEDREAREQLLADAKRHRLEAERRAIKRNATTRKEQPILRQASLKEQKKLKIKADLDTFDDLNKDSPVGVKRVTGKRPRDSIKKVGHP
jgi:hypothetical protein